MKQAFFLVALFLVYSSYSQDKTSCISGNCENGIGTYVWGADSNSPGDKYVGGWKNGLFHGKGTYTYASGESYVGDYTEGKRNGYGIQKYKNGSMYKGEWKNGVRNGYGTMVYSDGSRYEGDWLNDAQNRQGTFFFSKGDKFTGTWRDGVREGKGVYIYKDGEKKEGYWKNDEFVTELAMEDSKSQITPAEGIIKLSEKKLLQLSVKNAPVYLVFTYDKSLQLNMEIATQKGELLYSVDLSAGNSVKIGENGNYQITLIDRIGAGRWKVLLMNETEFNR